MTLTRFQPGPRMSKAVVADNIIHLAGQVPDDLDADVATQTRQVLANIDSVLAELGASKADLISIQVWLDDIADIGVMNEVWDTWVDPQNPPARATGGVRLARAGMRVEMIAVARLPG
ncbi:RidA family protein [Ponticoccus gilvus]|nr:RidA family protein [Enemella evansiae]